MSRKGSKQTLEHIRKRAIALTGKKLSKEHIEKLRLSHLGYKRTQQQNDRLRLFYKKYGHPMKGKKLSKEHRLKLSLAKLGTHRSEETKEKIRLSTSGEKGNAWLGGISFLPYSLEWTKKLRDDIRRRDNYRCKICLLSQSEHIDKYNKKLDVHHIDYSKKNCDPNNLITLCHRCHTKTNFSRDKWTKYFCDNNEDR